MRNRYLTRFRRMFELIVITTSFMQEPTVLFDLPDHF